MPAIRRWNGVEWEYVGAVSIADEGSGAVSRPLGMRWWDTRIYANEDADLNILIVGDSISEGFTASTLDKAYFRRMTRSISDRLGRSRGVFHHAAPGLAGYPNPSHDVWTRVGGVNDNTSKLGLGMRCWYTATNGESISGTFRAKQFRCLFAGSSITGNARIYIDGVLAATFSTNTSASHGGDPAGVEWTSGTLDLGDHTIRIENDGAGSFIALSGIMVVEDPAFTVNVWTAAHATYTAASWASTTDVPTYWHTDLAHTEADVAILALGVNDETSTRTPVQLATDLATIAGRINTALATDPSIVLLVQWAYGIDTAGTWDPYAEAIRQLAVDNDWGLIDIDAFVGYTVGDPYGLNEDDLHPNDAGMGLWANLAAKYLLHDVPANLERVVRSDDIKHIQVSTAAARDALSPADEQTYYMIEG